MRLENALLPLIALPHTHITLYNIVILLKVYFFKPLLTRNVMGMSSLWFVILNICNQKMIR